MRRDEGRHHEIFMREDLFVTRYLPRSSGRSLIATLRWRPSHAPSCAARGRHGETHEARMFTAFLGATPALPKMFDAKTARIERTMAITPKSGRLFGGGQFFFSTPSARTTTTAEILATTAGSKPTPTAFLFSVVTNRLTHQLNNMVA